jgi:hypothetical protein
VNYIWHNIHSGTGDESARDADRMQITVVCINLLELNRYKCYVVTIKSGLYRVMD